MTSTAAAGTTQPQEIAEAALRASSADGCVVIVAESSETNLRWATNDLTTNGVMHSRSVTVISTFGRPGGTSAGVITRSLATLDEIDDLVRASEAAGRGADPADDAYALVEPSNADTTQAGAGRDGWDSDPARTGVEVFDRFATRLGGALRRWQGADRLLYGFAEHRMTSYFLATSTGLRRRFDQPDGRLEINGKSADLTRSVWDGVHSEEYADIDVDAVVAGLEQRLSWATRTIDLPPGRYETLLPPTTVADLMIDLYWTASSRDADEGRSVFAGRDGGTRVGEQLSPMPLRMYSDPTAPGLRCPDFELATASSAGVSSVFDNGLPVGPTDWISDGRLANLARTRAWAAQTNARPQPYIDNLVLELPGAATTLPDMIAATERGLLLTSMWYIREVDPQTLLLTGLTRDGVYLVEDGQVRGAVNNFRFNESPVDLLTRVSEVGRTEHTLPREWSDYFTRASMPAMRIPDFNMSTVSQAS